MRLPNGDKAIVDVRKLREYCLNPNHFRGQHKARVFRRVLNIGPEAADWLRERLLEAARSHEADLATSDSFGQRYVLDFPVRGVDGEVTIRSCWILKTDESAPRLTSCFVR